MNKPPPDLNIRVNKFSAIPTKTWHQVLALRSEIFVVEQQCVYLDPDDHDINAMHCYVISDKSVVGYARILDEHEWKIGRILIDTKYRGHGLSYTIVESVINFIKAEMNSSKPISLSAQVYLSSFYEKLGFIPTGLMYLEDGIPHLRMVYQRS